MKNIHQCLLSFRALVLFSYIPVNFGVEPHLNVYLKLKSGLSFQEIWSKSVLHCDQHHELFQLVTENERRQQEANCQEIFTIQGQEFVQSTLELGTNEFFINKSENENCVEIMHCEEKEINNEKYVLCNLINLENEKVPNVFSYKPGEAIPEAKCPPIKLQLKPGIKPEDLFSVTRARQVPFALRGMALKELEDGVKTGIFRRLPLGTNVQFMSPAHWIPKGVDPKTGKNLGLRLVIDARQLNKVLVRTPFPYVPIMAQIKDIPRDHLCFQKVDIVKGYWTIPYDKKTVDSGLTTF